MKLDAPSSTAAEIIQRAEKIRNYSFAKRALFIWAPENNLNALSDELVPQLRKKKVLICNHVMFTQHAVKVGVQTTIDTKRAGHNQLKKLIVDGKLFKLEHVDQERWAMLYEQINSLRMVQKEGGSFTYECSGKSDHLMSLNLVLWVAQCWVDFAQVCFAYEAYNYQCSCITGMCGRKPNQNVMRTLPPPSKNNPQRKYGNPPKKNIRK